MKMNAKELARKIAEESIVLLKNKNYTLPFKEGQKAAFFGRAQIHTVFSGNGSGASKATEVTSILMECEKQGICVEPELKEFYLAQAAVDESDKERQMDFNNVPEGMTCGFMYEIFGQYHAPEKEYEVPDELFAKATVFTDTAVVVIGRNSGGEECDRYLKRDYYLTESETELLNKVTKNFRKIVVLLNVNGLIDLSWAEQYENIQSILFLGICGEQGAAAVAEILTGKVNPSGKLAVTIAEKYQDYPSAKHFSWEKDNPDKILTYADYGLDARENGSHGYDKSPVTVYWEDIYSGYRYFDTFGVEPLYPFGFGLSYSVFELKCQKVEKQETGITLTIQAKNVGTVPGREVVQAYLSPVNTERPYQELKGFAKTGMLNTGEAEEMTIEIPWTEFACYKPEMAAYVIEKGTYFVTFGNSSKDTTPTVKVEVETDIVLQVLKNRLQIKECNQDKIEFLCRKNQGEYKKNQEECRQDQKECRENRTKYRGTQGEAAVEVEIETAIETILLNETNILPIVPNKRNEYAKSHDLQEFRVEELAALCVGYGPGIPFSAFGDGKDPNTIFDESGKPLTINSHPTGMNGYVSPAMEEKGIYSISYKDGPSGIGEVAWPSEMLLACAFDRKLWREFGDAVGQECEKQQVDIWLAPAMNLHRNPLCGRNFEYFSEDPYLTGVCGCEITRGVQENHTVLVCPKHFAINEQETFRRGSAKKNYDAVDSIITERAARELYLKPFEMLVREADVACIMTSFNKINGVFAGGNQDLCTGILREEWGFEGAVVTDWGDMDIVVDGADAVMAGNDIVMPGGPPVIKQILTGYQEGRVTREALETAVGHLLVMLEKRKEQHESNI